MPALSVPALRKQIAERRLAPIYLFVGEDVKLAGQMLDAIESVVDAADRPFAVERVYVGEAGGSPLEIVASVQAMPMLGDRRIVTVMRAERLLKPKRGSKAAAREDEDGGGEDEGESESVDAEPLEAYFASPAPSSTLVFVASDVDRGRRLTKRLLQAAAVVEFGGFEGADRGAQGDAGRLLREEVAAAGKRIDAEAGRLMLERSGGDVTKLRGNIERLLLFTEGRPRITAHDVLEVVADDSGVEDDWAVVDAIAEGDPARALVETGKRFDRGDSPHQLVGQLRWWVSTRLAPAAPARVKPALDAVLRTDLALKSSGGDARVLVERLVVELTGTPVQSGRGGWRRR